MSRSPATGGGARRFKPHPSYTDSGVEWLGEIPAHWRVFTDRLQAVGVLGPYRRGVAERDEPRLAVALLYRVGLGAKQAGLA